MAMPIMTAVQTSLRKYRRKKLRTFFGIAPTVFLFVFIVLLSGLAISLDNFVNHRILEKLEQKEEVFELVKANGFFNGPPPPQADPRSDADDPSSYTDGDAAKIKAIDHVADVQPERPLPDMLAVTDDLVAGKELQLSSLVGAPADLARIYNVESFTYQKGDPIPIIISRGTFNYQYLDFGGKNDITVSGSDFGNPEKQRLLNPRKTTFLTNEYQRSQLLGKHFTVTMGRLSVGALYSEKMTFSGPNASQTFHKFSDSEQEVEKKKQRDKISPYWDYDSLQKGISVKFKIVGFNESLDGPAQFIPLAASSDILQQLYDLQRSARTKTIIPEDIYGSLISGLKLSKAGHISGNDSGVAGPIDLIPSKQEVEGAPTGGVSEAIAIPGFVYQFKSKDNTSVPSEVIDFIFKPEALAIKSFAVRIDDAGNRAKVQKSLTSSGYPEAQGGASFTGILRGIRNGINTVLFWVVVILTAINSLILVSAVSRTVADAQREIGVYRALGARKSDIRKLYVIYSALQTAVGIGAGLLWGVILLKPFSRFLASKISALFPLDSTLEGSYMGFDLKVTPSDLQHIDWLKIVTYSAALLLVTIIVSLIPAERAARISPIEAIRRAD